MKIVVLDSTAVVKDGPGSPAFFSRYAIAHLKALGHEVTIADGFNADLCRTADVVWTEWCNQDLLEAAESGVCKKLVARLRGFEAHWPPLGYANWGNVDHLCYESPLLKWMVEERWPGLRGFRSSVLPSGVDVAHIHYKERKHGPVVALAARAISDKGFQLAFEWARQRPDIRLHVAVALAQANDRLMRYLEHVVPPNVQIYHDVNTTEWLDAIDANYLLSASTWESLGYTIAEAMALGIKPLIHDTPGADVNWPVPFWPVSRWRSLAELSAIVPEDGNIQYVSSAYRAYVEEHLDAAKLSAAFADIVLTPNAVPRQPRPPQSANTLIGQANRVLDAGDLDQAVKLVTDFREHTQRLGPLDDHRAGLAFRLAAKLYEENRLDDARVWALRSLGDVVQPDTMALLGHIAVAQEDHENAARWLTAAYMGDRIPTSYYAPIEGSMSPWDVVPKLEPGETPARFLVVVAARNAEKYIGRCLASIETQTAPRVAHVAIDDASTDGTLAEIKKHGFTYVANAERHYSLYNIVRTVRTFGRPGDVVVIVDGDDALRPGALEHIEVAYRNGAWMTYGNFISSSKRPNWMPPYPYRVLRDGRVREWPWLVSHPKTFKIELFNHLTDEDFTEGGKWFQTAGDVALMLPMLELAGERAVWIPAELYEYNDENAVSDYRVDPQGQVRVRELIYAKPKKSKLESL